jgi:ferric-dicitrate binding protein FerR (iron transport regulator)
LTGVAHFDVAAGKPLPFRVRAGNAVITATGTSFAVRAYEGDSTVLVSVTEGTVDVALRDGDAKETVTAGNAVRIVGDTIAPLDAAARDLAMAWTRDTLIFENMSVKNVLTELGRWFDMSPKLADPSLGDRTVSLRLALKSSGDAIKALADSARLQIGFDKDEKVVLSDAPPAPEKPAKKK